MQEFLNKIYVVIIMQMDSKWSINSYEMILIKFSSTYFDRNPFQKVLLYFIWHLRWGLKKIKGIKGINSFIDLLFTYYV